MPPTPPAPPPLPVPTLWKAPPPNLPPQRRGTPSTMSGPSDLSSQALSPATASGEIPRVTWAASQEWPPPPPTVPAYNSRRGRLAVSSSLETETGAPLRRVSSVPGHLQRPRDVGAPRRRRTRSVSAWSSSAAAAWERGVATPHPPPRCSICRCPRPDCDELSALTGLPCGRLPAPVSAPAPNAITEASPRTASRWQRLVRRVLQERGCRPARLLLRLALLAHPPALPPPTRRVDRSHSP